jgi:hypothetical protein
LSVIQSLRFCSDKLFAIAFAVLCTISYVADGVAQVLSAEELKNRVIHRRAVEAVSWGMPAVNYDLMVQALFRAGGKWNQIVYWSRPSDWKNQTLTPNPDTIYIMPFFNTKDVGPVVLEIPPADGGSITGSVDDAWQTALADVGPAGTDKGRGGKYLILPPGYQDPIPAGYFPLASSTYQTYALLRSNLSGRSDDEVAKAVAYGRRIKVYPLAQADNPPETIFTDVFGRLYDATIPTDVRFLESLDRIVQAEPWLERDRVMIDLLKTIGIEKGKPFAPADTPALNDAIREARDFINAKYEAMFVPPFFEDRQWAVPVPPELIHGLQTNYSEVGSYPIDARGALYSMGFFSAKNLGVGQFYLLTIKDADGQPLDGGSSYVLRVPANPPVDLYWSVTAYDRETHALLRKMPRASLASNARGVRKNPDGSVDVTFAANAPAGQESNWVPTDPQRGFELMLRVYGPRKEFFDKAWVLPDVEKITARAGDKP